MVACIGKASLSDYTPEEDFILGTMLGYSRLQQCSRYLTRKDKCPAGECMLKSEACDSALDHSKPKESGKVLPFPKEGGRKRISKHRGLGL